MHHMRGPEESVFMTYSVKPIIAKIIGKKYKDPSPPGKGYGKNPHVEIDKSQRGQHECFSEKTNEHIPQPHAYGSCSILKSIGSHIFFAGHEYFYDQRKYKKWNSVMNDIWNVRNVNYCIH